MGGNSVAWKGDTVVELRLPRSKREGIIFGCVIAFISSMLIGGYNVYDNMGYDLEHFGDFVSDFLVIWPVMFAVAFTLSYTLVGPLAGRVVRHYMAPTDSANTFICFNLIVCVLMMSVILTFLGGLIGQAIAFLLSGHEMDVMELVYNWPRIWPRNFCIAFWVEMLIAQPAARRVMVIIHRKAFSPQAETA